VGKQAPPARAAPSLVRALRDPRGASCSLPGQACPNTAEVSFLQVDRQAGTKNGPQPNKETAFRQWRATSVLIYSPQAGVDNLLDTCGAIKERKNGLSRSEQKTVSTTQNNRLTEKAPYKSTANSVSGHIVYRRGARPRARKQAQSASSGDRPLPPHRASDAAVQGAFRHSAPASCAVDAQCREAHRRPASSTNRTVQIARRVQRLTPYQPQRSVQPAHLAYDNQDPARRPRSLLR